MNPVLLPPHVLDKMSPLDRSALGKAGRTQGEIEAKILAGRETEFQKQVCALLRLNGITFGYSNPSKKTTYTVGWPDFVFPYRDFFVCWEAKTVEGKLSPDQRRVRDGLSAESCVSFRVIQSLDDAQKHLRELDAVSSDAPNLRDFNTLKK